jgi:hypothetical protein
MPGSALTRSLLGSLTSSLSQETTTACRIACASASSAHYNVHPICTFASIAPTFATHPTIAELLALKYWLGEQRQAGGYRKNRLADMVCDIYIAPGA